MSINYQMSRYKKWKQKLDFNKDKIRKLAHVCQ